MNTNTAAVCCQVLKFDGPREKNAFVDAIKEFCNTCGLTQRSAMQSQKELLADAVTKAKRKATTDKFFRIVFRHVSSELVMFLLCAVPIAESVIKTYLDSFLTIKTLLMFSLQHDILPNYSGKQLFHQHKSLF